MGHDILKLENLVKSFNGNTVISNVSLAILEGELSAIIGPNGAGICSRLILSGWALHGPFR
jgi:ABC-type branched-subunit amino acid transport system ATPase component